MGAGCLAFCSRMLRSFLRAVQARADRAAFAVADLGDLVGRVAFDVMQMHGESSRLGELFHRLPHGASDEVGDGVRFGIGRGIGVGEGAGAVAPIGMRGGCLAPLSARSPQLMAAIDGYAQKPCFQMLAVDEVRPIIEKAEKHVLGNVFRILRGTCLVECQSIDGAAVIVHRLLHERCRPWSARGMVVGSRAGGCWSRGALARAADLRGRGRRGWLFLRICAADGGLVLCHFFSPPRILTCGRQADCSSNGRMQREKRVGLRGAAFEDLRCVG